MVRLLAVPIVAAILWSHQATATRPLPDHDSFVDTTRNNLLRSQREQYRFAFKERRTELHTNPFGRLGSGGLLVYEVTPREGGSVIERRLIERDGQPVRNASIEKTDLREQQRAEQQRPPRRSGLDDSISMLDFALDRRESANGRSMIVVNFTPKPNGKPETSEGRIAKLFKGSVWIDEAQHEVVRIEATAIDDITIGMGLVARLNEGTRATVTREQIDGSIWLPTSIRFVGEGRALLFRRLSIDQRIEWFDYRKLI